MRHWAIALVAATLSSCAPRGPLRPVTPARIAFDAAWLSELELPETRGRGLVLLLESPQEATPAVLLADSPASFTIFDGLAPETHTKSSPDGKHFPRVEAASSAQVVAMLTATRATEAYEVIRALTFARLMNERGEHAACEALLRNVDDDASRIRLRAMHAKGTLIANEAVASYAKGGSRAAVTHRLEVAATMRGPGADYAATLVPQLRALGAPPEAPAGDPLVVLTRSRVDALREQLCPEVTSPAPWPVAAPAGRVLALGLSALPELQRAANDPRPSRCLTHDASVTSRESSVLRLATLGALCKSLANTLTSGGATDDSDVECGPHVSDSQALQLLDATLATSDIAAAIAIAQNARGRLRVKMVDRLANGAGAAARGFILNEASAGPVLLARVEAARVEGARGEAGWAPSLAGPVSDAVAHEDASDGVRCDAAELSQQGLSLLLRFAPTMTLKMLSRDFESYGPRARVHVASELASWVAKTAADAKTRDALLLRALDDSRPATGITVALHGARCVDPTPAEIAASALSKRVGTQFSCNLDATARARALSAIAAKLAGHP